MADKEEERDVNFFDLLNPKQKRSNKELLDHRMSICKECPFLNQKTVQCTKCGCFMSLKTTLLSAKCPVGKW